MTLCNKIIKFRKEGAKIRKATSNIKKEELVKLAKNLASEYSLLLKLILFKKFVVSFTVEKTFNLPIFPGVTLRGAFGWALKRNACALRRGNEEFAYQNNSCDTCSAREYCPYVKIFKSPNGNESQFTHSPAFVIEAPINLKTNYSPGETYEFGITIFGKYINYILFIVDSVKLMGRFGFGDGKATVDKVYFEDPVTKERQIFIDNKTGLLYKLKPIKQAKTKRRIEELLKSNTLTISFVSPVKARVDKRISPELTFTNLIRLIIRRTNQLSSYYGIKDSGPSKKPLLSIYDTKKLVEDSKRIETVNYDLYDFPIERFSKSGNVKMNLNGFTGSVTYRGDFSKFIPLLLLGERLHIGKNASFGLGRYEIV